DEVREQGLAALALAREVDEGLQQGAPQHHAERTPHGQDQPVARLDPVRRLRRFFRVARSPLGSTHECGASMIRPDACGLPGCRRIGSLMDQVPNSPPTRSAVSEIALLAGIAALALVLRLPGLAHAPLSSSELPFVTPPGLDDGANTTILQSLLDRCARWFGDRAL